LTLYPISATNVFKGEDGTADATAYVTGTLGRNAVKSQLVKFESASVHWPSTAASKMVLPWDGQAHLRLDFAGESKLLTRKYGHTHDDGDGDGAAGADNGTTGLVRGHRDVNLMLLDPGSRQEYELRLRGAKHCVIKFALTLHLV
jgi:hypothetical protein